MLQTYLKKLIIISLLITAGIFLEITGLLDADEMLIIARKYADHWWLVLLLILLQSLLFTFALAGSFFLWIAAPLYPPLMSTFILVCGGTLGGISAYFFSRSLTDDLIEKIEKSRTYRILQSQDNFFTLFALRVFPAFPHSFVNYSSGILQVKLGHFIAAAISGIAIKSYVYSDIIYNTSTAATFKDLLNFSTFAPLILLSVITLSGVYIHYRLKARP